MTYIQYAPASRFGNWLFQYAVAMSIAKGKGVAFYVDPSLPESHVEMLLKRGEVMRGVQVVRELPPNVKVLKGIPQIPQAFDAPMVRELYRVPERIDHFIRENYPHILSAPLRVSIHVRRGDYLKWPHRHPFVGRAYLRTAVQMFPPNSLFVVCSDDMPWCKRFFTKRNFPLRQFAFVDGGDALSDMYMATYCHHNIMSNSTFSWWGAWLNQNPGKRVIMPSHWYGMEIGSKDSASNVVALSYPSVEVVRNHYELSSFCLALLLCAKTRIGFGLRKCGAL